jgi:RNA polymerase sigma factor (sigma-70 family)
MTDEEVNKMLLDNLGLVHSVAKRYRGSHMEYADMVQEGCIGLLTAIQKFDPNRGIKFSTHATWWIRAAITGALRSQEQFIHVPNPTRDSSRQKQPRVRVPMAAALAEQRQEVDGASEWRLALDDLAPRVAQMVWLRHAEGMTYREIAARVGLSHEGVRKVLKKAGVFV